MKSFLYWLIPLSSACVIAACSSTGDVEGNTTGAGGMRQDSTATGTGSGGSRPTSTTSSSSSVSGSTTTAATGTSTSSVTSSSSSSTSSTTASSTTASSTSTGAGGDAGSGDAGHVDAGGGDAGGSGYNPCPTNGDPCKVLPLGDSITWGIQYDGAYRVELFRRAVAANQNITFLGSLMNGPAMIGGAAFPPHNEGHSGWTINQIAGLVPSPALDDHPDIILLLIGTNDTYMANPGGAPQRLATLLDKILSMDTHALLVVSLITPYPSQATNVASYNKAIPPLIQARAAAGKHILLTDVNTGFKTATMLSNDGIHPNQTGYEFMGGVWYGAVGSLFPQKH